MADILVVQQPEPPLRGCVILVPPPGIHEECKQQQGEHRGGYSDGEHDHVCPGRVGSAVVRLMCRPAHVVTLDCRCICCCSDNLCSGFDSGGEVRGGDGHGVGVMFGTCHGWVMTGSMKPFRLIMRVEKKKGQLTASASAGEREVDSARVDVQVRCIHAARVRIDTQWTGGSCVCVEHRLQRRADRVRDQVAGDVGDRGLRVRLRR